MLSARKVVGRPFQKGHDPRRNPHGPRAQPVTRALAKTLTEKRAEKIAEVVVAAAEAGESWAVQFLADRLEGKAVARNEQGQPGEFDTSVDVQPHVIRPGEAE